MTTKVRQDSTKIFSKNNGCSVPITIFFSICQFLSMREERHVMAADSRDWSINDAFFNELLSCCCCCCVHACPCTLYLDTGIERQRHIWSSDNVYIWWRRWRLIFVRFQYYRWTKSAMTGLSSSANLRILQQLWRQRKYKVDSNN